MTLFHIANQQLTPLTQTTFAAEGLQERQDLQEALKRNIAAIAPDCLVIADEFSDWEDSRRVSIHRNSIDTGKMRRSSLDPTFLLA